MPDAQGILKPGTLVRARCDLTLRASHGIVVTHVPERTYGVVEYEGPEEHDEVVDEETGEVVGYNAYGIMWLCADEPKCIVVNTKHLDVIERQVV